MAQEKTIESTSKEIAEKARLAALDLETKAEAEKKAESEKDWEFLAKRAREIEMIERNLNPNSERSMLAKETRKSIEYHAGLDDLQANGVEIDEELETENDVDWYAEFKKTYAILGYDLEEPEQTIDPIEEKNNAPISAISELESVEDKINSSRAKVDELERIDNDLIKGTFVDSGKAHYQHDTNNSMSFYVKLKTDTGEEREIWGVDLERATNEKELAKGERIALSNEGKETVSLEEGQEVEKNTWGIKNETELNSFELELDENRKNLNKLNEEKLKIEVEALKEQEAIDEKNLALSRAVDAKYEQYNKGEIEFSDIQATDELKEGFEINSAVAHYRIQSKKLANNEITKDAFEKDEKALAGKKLEESLNRARESEIEKNSDNFIEAPESSYQGENEIQNFEMGGDARAIESLPDDLKSNFEGKEKKGRAYYYDKKNDSVAFVDKGNKLQSARKFDQTSIRTMVRLAQNRGWSELKVKGDESFRKEVYLEAAKRGIEVKGYKPSEADKEIADKAKARYGKNQKAAKAFENAKTAEEKAKAAKRHPSLAKAYAVQAALHAMAKQKKLPKDYRDAMMSRINQKLAQDLRDGKNLPNLQVKRNRQRRQETAATLER